MDFRRASNLPKNPIAPPLPQNIDKTAFLLDFDGTLVDIAPTPDAVMIAPRLPEILRRLRARTGDALAIISGRMIAEIDHFLPDIPYAVSGEHGAAIRAAPGVEIVHVETPSPMGEWISKARDFSLAFEGSVIEPKRSGLVLHYRNCPEAEGDFAHFAHQLIANYPDFHVQLAKMAWEIRPKAVDKGEAVARIMALPTFSGKMPVFVGDDKTDLDGVHMARAMGGKGYLIPEDFVTSAVFRAWLYQCAEMH